MKKKLVNSIKLFLFIFFSIVYLELLFKIRLFENLNFDAELLKMFLFAFSYSAMIMFFIMFFKPKSVYVMTLSIMSFITFLFINQEIYNSIVNNFYSFAIAGDFALGLSFINKYLEAITFGMNTYFLPIVLLLLFSNLEYFTFDVEYESIKHPLLGIGVIILLFFASLQTIDETVEGSTSELVYSDMDLYTFMYNPQKALKKFGLLTYTQRDFFSLFRIDPLTEEDHETLLEEYLQEKYDELDYNRNEYSNMFHSSKNNKKNFILIMAESLDTYAIHPELTPTLYDFMQESAYFENYYSPLYYRSTADTEFMTQTSFFPDKNVTLSMDQYLENTLPYTLPKMFEKLGYKTYSFHNYTDYFYPRKQFHEQTLGYDHYFGAVELGMLPEPEGIINNHDWQSDLELFQLSLDAPIYNDFGEVVDTVSFLEDDYFFVNYITVSGHFRYSKNHEVAQLHYQTVETYFDDHPEEQRPDDSIIYYLATHMELDLGLQYLKEELIRTGKWDDTVIMVYSDHYAYGLDDNVIWEYDTMKNAEDRNPDMEIHNVPMMICVGDGATLETVSCDGQPELTGTIPNYMSSIDILPTVANLFGLPLNYKYAFGKDVFSFEENFVRFGDMSFVNEYMYYDSLSEEYSFKESFILDTVPNSFDLYSNNISIGLYLSDDYYIAPEGYESKEEYIQVYMENYMKLINAEMVRDYQYNVSLLQLDFFKPPENEE